MVTSPTGISTATGFALVSWGQSRRFDVKRVSRAMSNHMMFFRRFRMGWVHIVVVVVVVMSETFSLSVLCSCCISDALPTHSQRPVLVAMVWASRQAREIDGGKCGG